MLSSQPKLVNYSQVNELYNTLFEPKEFSEFEYRLFNNNLDIDKINIEHLFIDKNEEAILSISNYESIYNKYSELYVKCMNYLVQLGNVKGYLKLGNFTLEVKKDKETAIKLYTYGGNKGSSMCFYNAAIAYFKDAQYLETLQMLDKAIKLSNNIPEYYQLYAHVYANCNDIPNMIKYLYLAIKSGEGSKIALDIFEQMAGSNSLYQILLRVKSPNSLIQQKTRDLSKRVTDTTYYDDIVIQIDDTTTLYTYDFEPLCECSPSDISENK